MAACKGRRLNAQKLGSTGATISEYEGRLSYIISVYTKGREQTILFSFSWVEADRDLNVTENRSPHDHTTRLSSGADSRSSSSLLSCLNLWEAQWLSATNNSSLLLNMASKILLTSWWVKATWIL